MSGKYIIGIDQSTQGTKGMLFDEKGAIAGPQGYSPPSDC